MLLHSLQPPHNPLELHRATPFEAQDWSTSTSPRSNTSTFIGREPLSFALRHSTSQTLHPSSFRLARPITLVCRSRSKLLGALQAQATAAFCRLAQKFISKGHI